MKTGDFAELKMKKSLLIGSVLETEAFPFKVLYYDEKKECIYLLLQEGELTKLSLDCIYECCVKSKNATVRCTGRIKERYNGYKGKIIKFQIENGFYKINIKSVDKQIG